MKLTIGLLLFTFILHSVAQDDLSNENRDSLFISTIDGALTSVDSLTGEVHWTLQEEPVLRVPLNEQSGFLASPEDGSLFALFDSKISKLPFTIPQLVHTTPCKSTDGMLYAGSKKDTWLALDPDTGRRLEPPNEELSAFCPASNRHALFIGRTQYHIEIFDEKTRTKRWNVTFTDYSSHVMPADTNYALKHYGVCSDGRFATVNKMNDDLLWQRQFNSTVVAIYILQSNGLHRLPYTPLGSEAFESLAPIAHPPKIDHALETLHRTLYVGQTPYGLFALPSFVDRRTITISNQGRGPPLLDGPHPLLEEPLNRPTMVVDIELARIMYGEFILLGHYESPETIDYRLEGRVPIFPQRQQQLRYPSLPYKPSTQPQRVIIEDLVVQFVVDNKATVIIGTVTFFTIIITSAFICCNFVARQTASRVVLSARHSDSQGNKIDISLPPGWQQVGAVSWHPAQILGRGCEGTVVFRGAFGGREVAVKRIVAQFTELADREVELLRESDRHANVVRYYCTVFDTQFIYIALELCWASLHDYIEKADVRQQCKLTPIELLRQATAGLEHLHNLKIVHRDIKPQNVLLAADAPRAVISDFGLCKKLAHGRNSLSKRSGVAGTEGWMSPEVLLSDESVSCASDVFSLGCVYYYVLSGGRHPFGDALQRQANIALNEYSLEKLDASSARLIDRMLQRRPRRRPPSSALLVHPMFWDKAKQLHFLQDVSDRIESDEAHSLVMYRLENNRRAVVIQDWHQHICQPLKNDLRRHRTYRGDSVRDLLRAMRNKKHHYRELEPELQKSLGAIPDQFITYFTSRFPLLIMHTYEAVECLRDEAPLARYYPKDYKFATDDTPTDVPDWFVERSLMQARKKNKNNNNNSKKSKTRCDVIG